MVGREGFEPPKSETPRLQRGAFGHFATDPRNTQEILAKYLEY